MKDLETRYLERLSDLYPTIAAASTEIINLQAILNLPKGTELVEESFMMGWKVMREKVFLHWTKRSVRTGGISCGISGSTPDSPLFGKNKMATFERYFLAEKETHVEKKNPYYALLENEEAIEKEKDIHSEIMVVKRVMDRILVGDTDVGRELREQVADLERLLAAYRSGEIIEKV